MYVRPDELSIGREDVLHTHLTICLERCHKLLGQLARVVVRIGDKNSILRPIIPEYSNIHVDTMRMAVVRSETVSNAGGVPIISDADALGELYADVADIIPGKPSLSIERWVHEVKHVERVHFDVRHLNLIVWKDSDMSDLKERVKNRIVSAIGPGPVRPT
jgi:hypothetical protein